jgi:S-formylglutathione hydrolase FrmB
MIIVKRFSFLLTLVFVIAFSGPTQAQQANAPALSSKLLELKVPAPSLKGNLLGEPTEQPVFVYLPPSYATSPSKRYPTLYLLHGFLGTSKLWISGAFQGMNLQSVMDASINGQKVREMIVVAANGSNAYGGSFYTNSPVTGNWEDFITRDLVSNVDANYRTLPKAESRGIAGHSMGGYGAVMLAMKHPEVFSATYALSPCCLAMESDMSEANPAWSKVLGLTSSDYLKARPASVDDFYTYVFVALGAAFSPNSARAPLYVDFPVETTPGGCGSSTNGGPCLKKNDAVYEKWRAKIPSYIASANKENLKQLHGIFLDYGQNEQFAHIRTGVQLFSKTLAELSIPHQFEVYPDGDHGSRIRLRIETRVIQFFNEKLVFEKETK